MRVFWRAYVDLCSSTPEGSIVQIGGWKLETRDTSLQNEAQIAPPSCVAQALRDAMDAPPLRARVRRARQSPLLTQTGVVSLFPKKLSKTQRSSKNKKSHCVETLKIVTARAPSRSRLSIDRSIDRQRERVCVGTKSKRYDRPRRHKTQTREAQTWRESSEARP